MPGPQSDLNAVTALGPNDVWAVGSHTGLSTPRPLMFHWDGQAWHEVPAPAGADLGVWQAVSGIATNDIWAVGLSYSAAYCSPAPLIGHWTGSQWTVVPLPGSVPEAGVLRGVFARTPTDVWAVGSTNATGPRDLYRGPGLCTGMAASGCRSPTPCLPTSIISRASWRSPRTTYGSWARRAPSVRPIHRQAGLS